MIIQQLIILKKIQMNSKILKIMIIQEKVQMNCSRAAAAGRTVVNMKRYKKKIKI